jgi:hypothetical protein
MIATPPLPFALELPAAEILPLAAPARRRRHPWWPHEPRWIVLETFRPAPSCPHDGRCTFCGHADDCGSPRPAA